MRITLTRQQSGTDVRHWWPELQEHSELETRLSEEQDETFGRWQFWARWARTANGAGVLVLVAGLALSLPPPAAGAQGGLRWAAFGVTAAGCAGQACWTVGIWYRRWFRQARLPVPEGALRSVSELASASRGLAFTGY